MLRKVFCDVVLIMFIINMFVLISLSNIRPAKTAILVVPDDYPTIQDAVNAASSGDIIFVRAGTYLENIIVNKNISLIGEEKENTIIDGGGVDVAVKIMADCVKITGFTVRNHKTYDGVQLKSVRNCNISGNILMDNYFGVWLGMSLYNYISENIIVENRDGIVLYRSSQNVLYENNITDNLIGIYIYSSSTYNNLIENELSTNQVGIRLGASSNHNNISRNVVTGCSNGIELDSALNNNIYRNNITANSWVGISFTNAQRNEVYENVLQNNFYGISSEDSSYNSFMRNKIERNWHGVWIGDSYYNDINQNLIEKNQYGLELSYSLNNIISENNIVSNQYAVYLLYYSHDNKFYHNNLINNTHQVYDISNMYNIWDDGYPSGGNYWDDYTGADEKNGPNQDQLGGDGVGDEPYFINAQNIDRYPLMKPWPSHDIAIINVIPSKFVVEPGDSVYVNVTVINQGDFSETFNLTIYADMRAVDMIVISNLPIKCPATLLIIWNTTEYARGNYTITAYIAPVLSETDIVDNVYTDGTVMVGIHDIIISNITFSKQNPIVNETIFILVIIQNQGDFTEIFDVSVNYTRIFDPLIETQTITLCPGETIMLNFTWTTNDRGRYEIKAYTSFIPNDVNPQNNIKIAYIYVSGAYSSALFTNQDELEESCITGGRLLYMAYTR